MKYKVSVIIPIYNVEAFIEKCANSLFSQTLDKIEYIFVDDCSPDKSIALLKQTLNKYPQRVKDTQIIHHKQNRGSAASRNTGLSYASGEYIIFCDSDDWVEKNMYELLYDKAIAEHSDFVICDFVYEYAKRSILCTQCVLSNPKNLIKGLLIGFIHNGLWNKLIKRDIFNNLDFFCKEGINMLEDASVLPRIAFYSTKVSYVPKALYHYNQQNINSYTKIWSESSINNAFDAIGIIDTFFKSHTNTYETEVCNFKLNVKNLLIQHIPFYQFRRVKQEYPEVNRMVFKHPRLSLLNKIKLWCCFHSLILVSFIIAKAINIAKNILR